MSNNHGLDRRFHYHFKEKYRFEKESRERGEFIEDFFKEFTQEYPYYRAQGLFKEFGGIRRAWEPWWQTTVEPLLIQRLGEAGFPNRSEDFKTGPVSNLIALLKKKLYVYYETEPDES